jgi:hypothetical protein
MSPTDNDTSFQKAYQHNNTASMIREQHCMIVNADNLKFCEVASEKSMLPHMGIQMAATPGVCHLNLHYGFSKKWKLNDKDTNKLYNNNQLLQQCENIAPGLISPLQVGHAIVKCGMHYRNESLITFKHNGLKQF